MLPRVGDEPFVADGSSEFVVSPRELRQHTSTAAYDEPNTRRGSIGVRVSYAVKCSIEETVSRYLAARESVRGVMSESLPDALGRSPSL